MNSSDSKLNKKLEAFHFNQNMKISLALKLGLEELTCGKQIIRDEKGWREDEVFIDYIWITRIIRSFVGQGGLITLKFKPSQFRGVEKPEKLVQGIFLYNSKGMIKELYSEDLFDQIDDPVRFIKDLELFTANEAITLDGVSYEHHVLARNVETKINVNNPNSKQWKMWENEIWTLGNRLSRKSGNPEMYKLFE